MNFFLLKSNYLLIISIFMFFAVNINCFTSDCSIDFSDAFEVQIISDELNILFNLCVVGYLYDDSSHSLALITGSVFHPPRIA